MTGRLLLYVGTYSRPHPFGSAAARALRNLLARRPRAAGVYALWLDPVTGRIERGPITGEVENPSFLARHPSHPIVYVVSETHNGAVVAYSIDPATGQLEMLNRQESGGDAPCYAIVDETGNWLLVTNYDSGTIATLPIRLDGGLEPLAHVVHHTGSSIHRRQASPHPHAVAFAPGNRFALIPDLGADRIWLYRFDAGTGALQPADPPAHVVPAGTGPRHVAFHPSGRLLFVTGELASCVMSFRSDAEHARIAAAGTVSTLPAGWSGRSTGSDVHAHPRGRFVFASNRGHDSIAVLEAGPDGSLQRVHVERTGGRTPRGFAIDPDGRFLVVAHQDSDDVVSFRIDGETGVLREADRIAVPTGASVLFA